MDRAAIIAELETQTPVAEETAAVTKQVDPEVPPEEKAAPEPELETTPEPAQAKPDPELTKRLDAIQRAEKRAKDSVAKERQELERLRQEVNTTLEDVKRFQSLKQRAGHDPVAVMRALGVSEADFDYIARQFHLQSPEAVQKDPKLRDQADRDRRMRDRDDRLEQLTQQLQEVSQKLAHKEYAEQAERQISQYMASVTKAIDDKAPVVKGLLDRNPERARQRLRETAEMIANETGEAPEPHEVVSTLERRIQSELDELGIAHSKPAAPTAAEKKPAKSLSNDLSTPHAPRKELEDDEQLRADVKRALMEGRLE